MEGLLRDERERFARVALPHLSDGFALARWIAGSPHDAEDIVQDACLRAFKGINGYAGGNPRAWFLTIVRNTAYTWLKKNRPAEIVSVDDLDAVGRPGSGGAGFGLGDAETPETALVAKVDGERLQEAILALQPAFREALVLRELHGLEYREIALVTGAPVGTVMSRLARARRRLAAELCKDGG